MKPTRSVEGPRRPCEACETKTGICEYQKKKKDLLDLGYMLKREGKIDKQIRFALYRKYITETYGYLGVGNRLPPPACVEDGIKSEFPGVSNHDGSYVTFRTF
jgi:hypothetical protein